MNSVGNPLANDFNELQTARCLVFKLGLPFRNPFLLQEEMIPMSCIFTETAISHRIRVWYFKPTFTISINYMDPMGFARCGSLATGCLGGCLHAQ